MPQAGARALVSTTSKPTNRAGCFASTSESGNSYEGAPNYAYTSRDADTSC